jgi:hypothetical protein
MLTHESVTELTFRYKTWHANSVIKYHEAEDSPFAPAPCCIDSHQQNDTFL